MKRIQRNSLSTRSIDTASYIVAATGKDCEIQFNGLIASFTFEADPPTQRALIEFECGGQVEGKLLLEARNSLFRRIKGGGR